jgi:hypothetical protein
MTTQNPRLALTMKPELKRIYESTAEAMGIPTSRLIVQILAESSDLVTAMGKAVVKARSTTRTTTDPQLVIRGESPNEAQLDIEDQIIK